MAFAARLLRRAARACGRASLGNLERAVDGLRWLRARSLFQRSGLFAALPLTGRVLEVEGDRGHLAEAAVHHIPNRRCIVVDAGRQRRCRVDHRVRRRKFHRVCAPPDQLPFADACFDAAWTSFALARLDPATQEAVLAEMLRVVRPGGVLVLLERVPDTRSRRLQARLHELMTFSTPFGARSYRLAEQWRAALPRSGWHVEAEHVLTTGFGQPFCLTFVCRRI